MKKKTPEKECKGTPHCCGCHCHMHIPVCPLPHYPSYPIPPYNAPCFRCGQYGAHICYTWTNGGSTNPNITL